MILDGEKAIKQGRFHDAKKIFLKLIENNEENFLIHWYLGHVFFKLYNYTKAAKHIINSISNLSFGEEEARVYSQILDDLYKRNITLGSNDMIIGATAITSGYPVLTMNEKDFKRIPGLEVLSIKYI